MSDAADLTEHHFGMVIAYLIPGFAGLWGASYWSPSVRAWFGEAATKETSIGGFLFLVLAALGVGVLLQQARWAVFDVLVKGVAGKRLKIEYDDALDYKLMRDPGMRALVDQINDAHYRHHQFNGGLFVTMPLVYASWILFSDPQPGQFWPTTWALLAVEVLVFLAAIEALRRDCRKRNAALKPVDPPPTPPLITGATA